MDLDYLLQLLNNRLSVLQNGKVLAFNSGDLDTINKMDADILSTQDSINQIRLMQTLNNAASAANTTPQEVVTSGIDTVNGIITIDMPLGPLSVYDITSYATDPLHEKKIADILGYIGEMNSPAVIDAYIDTEAIDSPVTGDMVLSAASKYSVDARLIMAIMELDSRFGTAGVAIRTLNPGNVGNTDDGSTRTYTSWSEGVDAVAEWLSRHRIVPQATVDIQPVETVEQPVTPVVADVPVVPTEVPVTAPAPITVTEEPSPVVSASSTPVVEPVVEPVEPIILPIQEVSTTTAITD